MSIIYGNMVGGNSLVQTPGKSAYEYAVEGGYIGTEKEFAEKLAAELTSPDGSIWDLTISNDGVITPVKRMTDNISVSNGSLVILELENKPSLEGTTLTIS